MAHTLDGVVKHLQADSKYREPFRSAWGTDQITIDMVAKSIASFERTVVAGNSPFDRFYYGHDSKALPAAAQRGLKIFISSKKGNCAVCHTIGKDYALFTDNKFHNLGIGADTRGNLNDLGRYTVTNVEADKGCFKTTSAAATGIPISTRRFTRSMFSPSASATTCFSSSIRSTADCPTTSVRRQIWQLRRRQPPPPNSALLRSPGP
jgi:mono/diheme cytochrome c family protein